MLESWNVSKETIQTLIFLKLLLAGHSTIFITRTIDKPFWHKPYPSLKLFIAIFTTDIIGVLIAVYGVFMKAIGWEWAIYIWLYSTIWFLFNDFIKRITVKNIGGFYDKN